MTHAPSCGIKLWFGIKRRGVVWTFSICKSPPLAACVWRARTLQVEQELCEHHCIHVMVGVDGCLWLESKCFDLLLAQMIYPR